MIRRHSAPLPPTALLAALLLAALPARALQTDFTYQGRLEVDGTPVDGPCDLRFRLYGVAGGGTSLGEDNALGVAIENGLFTASLDFPAAFDGNDRWLEIDLRCPAGAGAYTTLAPRLRLTATPYALYAASTTWAGVASKPAGFADGQDSDTLGALACADGQVAKRAGGAWSCDADAIGGDIFGVAAGAGLSGGGGSGSVQLAVVFAGNGTADSAARSDHDHFGQEWVGAGTGLLVQNTEAMGRGLVGVQGEPNILIAAQATGVFGVSADGAGVYGFGLQGPGILGSSTAAHPGVLGLQNDGVGVEGHHEGNGTEPGVHGLTDSSSPNAAGVVGEVTRIGPGGFSAGVRGVNRGTGSNGIGVWGSHAGGGWAIYGTANTGIGAFGFSSSGVGVRAQSETANLLEAYSGDNPVFANRRFYVDNDGDVFADGSFNPNGADFAELLPGTAGLEPGDVLVIGADGALARSSEAAQSNVAGVYSTRPGVLGGGNEPRPGAVPLAVVGVVPVKASAENGAIVPGDLLTSSATPGHAMRAGSAPALGTVIGKALSGLAAGTGKVTLLVTLQ